MNLWSFLFANGNVHVGFKNDCGWKCELIEWMALWIKVVGERILHGDFVMVPGN